MCDTIVLYKMPNGEKGCTHMKKTNVTSFTAKLLISVIVMLLMLQSIMVSAEGVPDSYTDGLVFNMHFDSFGNNYTVYDEITRFWPWDGYSGNIGSIVGTPTIVEGFNGNAVSVSPGSYVNCTGYYINRGVGTASELTFSLWVNPATSDGVIVKRSNINISLSDNKVNSRIVFSSDSSELGIESDTELINGEWSNIVVTVGANDMKLYINGELEGSADIPSGKSYSFTDDYYGELYFGSQSTEGFTGCIDEASIYFSEMTEREVKEFYYTELSNATIWEHTKFPTDTVTALDAGIAFESENVFLLDEDFEGPVSLWRDEALSDIAHSGKLSLYINYKANDEFTEYYPLKKTFPFAVEESETTASAYSEQNEEQTFMLDVVDNERLVEIQPVEDKAELMSDGSDELSATLTTGTTPLELISDNEVLFAGTTKASQKVKLTIADSNGEILTDDFSMSDESGTFTFAAELDKSSEYIVFVSDDETTVVSTLSFAENGNAVLTALPELYQTTAKTNLVELWVYPGKNAEYIEFYAATDNYGYGIMDRMYVKILSDSDSDGIYTASNDFELGKWQKITLDLTKTAYGLGGNVTGLYMTANDGSDWYIDDITSSYRKIENTEFNLTSLEEENIVYTDNGTIEFAPDNENSGRYLTDTKVIYAHIPTDGYIHSLETEVKFAGAGNYTYSLAGDLHTNDPIAMSLSGEFIVYLDQGNELRYVRNNGNVREEGIILENCDYDAPLLSENGHYLVYDKALYHYDGESYIATGDVVSSPVYAVSNSGDMFYFNDDRLVNTEESLSLDISSDYVSNIFVTPDGSKIIIASSSSSTSSLMLEKRGAYYDIKYEIPVKIYEDAVTEFFFDEEANNLFFGKIRINLDTGRVYTLSIPNNICAVADGNKIIYKSEISNIKYVVHDIVTEEKELIYVPNASGSKFRYDVVNEKLYYSDGSNYIRVSDIRQSEELVKFFVSVNNGAWYSYDGAWRKICEGREPSTDEYRLYGMTSAEVNSIPASALGSLSSSNPVMSVNFAIRFSSYSSASTPSLKKIAVNTTPSLEYDVYAVRVDDFAKSDYSSINGVYATEGYAESAEVNYFIYIGDSYIYTYKNGMLVQVPGDAEYLFSDPEARESVIRKFGMTQKEISSIPSSVLNTLFLNSEYQNSNFGVVTVIKNSKKTTDFKTQVILSGNQKYIHSTESINVQIFMSDGTSITLTSADISANEAEKLLIWLENRQNNKGPVFYTVKTGQKTYFINYYMISSINVY